MTTKESINKKLTRNDESEIVSVLSKMVSDMKKLKDNDKKIEMLVEFDDFLKKNKEIIKEKYSDKMVSLLRSL